MRTAPVLAFALWLACAVPSGALRAQTAGALAADPPAADGLAPLPADLRGKFDGALEKAIAAKRDEFEQKMKAAAVALVKLSGMESDVPLKDLVTAMHVSEDRSLKEWEEAIRQRLDDRYRRDPELTAVSIEALSKLTASSDGKVQVPERLLLSIEAADDGAVKYTPPEEQSAWTEAIRRALTPGQLAAWQTSAAGEKKEEQEIATFLDAQVNRVREGFDAAMKVRIDEWREALEPSPDRAAKLEALGHLAVEQALRAYRADAGRNVRAMSADQRRRILAAILANQSGFGTQSNETPTRQEVWKLGLEAVLTDADRRRLAALQDERTERRARAMGRMLLVILDEKTALTASQREHLLAPAEEAVKQEKPLFPPAETQNYYQFTRESFFEAATHIKEDAARAILDPLQWQHWQQACKDSADGKENPRQRRGGNQRSDPDQGPVLAENAEPEELERFLSDAFEEKTRDERQRQLAMIMLKAEDIARVTDVGEAARARLQTAARGTVDKALAPWKANLAQNVRSQLENSDPENIRNVLSNLSNMQFGGFDPGQGPESRTLWDKTVDRELTAPQRARWQQEVETRAAYKEQSICALLLAEFDRRFQLSGAQRERLQEMLGKVLREYGQEIHRMFAYSSGSTPWYFQSYTMFLPLMGVSEDDLKPMLGKDRWTRWSGSVEHANGVQYWQNVQQTHDQRLKGNNP